jgi:hypothetical protein
MKCIESDRNCHSLLHNLLKVLNRGPTPSDQAELAGGHRSMQKLRCSPSVRGMVKSLAEHKGGTARYFHCSGLPCLWTADDKVACTSPFRGSSRRVAHAALSGAYVRGHWRTQLSGRRRARFNMLDARSRHLEVVVLVPVSSTLLFGEPLPRIQFLAVAPIIAGVTLSALSR